MTEITIDGVEWALPDIKFCPSCGSQKLEPRSDDWLERTKKRMAGFGECVDCGCHFHVSLCG